MTDLYQAASGHDNEAGYTTLNPQPFCPLGIQYPIYIMVPTRAVYPDGDAFCVWEWENITQAQYEAILTIMGLTTATSSISNEVTISTVTHNRDTFASYNATVIHRKGEDTEYAGRLFRLVTFKFTDLEAVT